MVRAADRDGPRPGTGTDRAGPVPDQAGPAGRTSPLAEAVAATAATWQAQLDKERARASVAEQAAAMWQERARGLEAELERALALPAHEEEPEPPRRRWWRWWRNGTKAHRDD